MSHFTALALDRFLEAGISKSDDESGPHSRASPDVEPVPNMKLDWKSDKPVTEQKTKSHKISPALYATPEATPLPDSPSSFPYSPFIVNHKRRGPRLLNSYSKNDLDTQQEALNEENDANNAETEANNLCDTVFEMKHGNAIYDSEDVSNNDRFGDSNGTLKSHHNVDFRNSNINVGSSILGNGLVRENDLPTPAALTAEGDSDSGDFFDPRDSMSITSSNGGDNNSGAERSLYPSTPMGEFFDAWEELSSEPESPSCFRDFGAELHAIKLSLLSETEKRKHAEEALCNVLCQWQRISKQLHVVGLTLPVDPTMISANQKSDMDPAEDLCQQIFVSRFVAESVVRDIVKAEAEMEMEAQLESKNFEIARLGERLKYYESMNREMTQRSRETAEMARNRRLQRKRRQKWIWSSIATAVALGTAALAWKYIPSGKESSSHFSRAQEGDGAAK